MREERGTPRSTIWLVWSRVERVAGRAAGNLFPLLAVLVLGAIVIGVLFVLAVLALAIAGALQGGRAILSIGPIFKIADQLDRDAIGAAVQGDLGQARSLVRVLHYFEQVVTKILPLPDGQMSVQASSSREAPDRSARSAGRGGAGRRCRVCGGDRLVWAEASFRYAFTHSPSLNTNHVILWTGRPADVASAWLTITIVEAVVFFGLAYLWRGRARVGSLRVRTIVPIVSAIVGRCSVSWARRSASDARARLVCERRPVNDRGMIRV